MFIPSFKKLSWLSLLGCISTVVVTVTVVAAVAMDPMREKMPQQVNISMTHLCIAGWWYMQLFLLSSSGLSCSTLAFTSYKTAMPDSVIQLHSRNANLSRSLLVMRLT